MNHHNLLRVRTLVVVSNVIIIIQTLVLIQKEVEPSPGQQVAFQVEVVLVLVYLICYTIEFYIIFSSLSCIITVY